MYHLLDFKHASIAWRIDTRSGPLVTHGAQSATRLCGVTGHCMRTACTQHAHSMHTACAQRAHSMHTACTRQVLATLSYSFSAGMLGASKLLVQGSSSPLMKGCSGVGGGSWNTLKAVACMIQSGVNPMRSTCFSLSAAATLASPTWSSNSNSIQI